MLKRGNKGQVQLSFGMIFSILIIVVTILVAGYVIIKFLEIKDDASCKIFYQKLQDTIDDVWKGEGASIELSKEPILNLPGSVKKICFGNTTQRLIDKTDEEIFDELKYFGDKKDNLIFSPSDACGSKTFTYTLNHINTEGFFCVPAEKGKVELIVKKDKKDALVSLCKPSADNCK